MPRLTPAVCKIHARLLALFTPQTTEEARAFLEKDLERVKQEAAALLQEQKERHAAVEAALSEQLNAVHLRLRETETALAQERAQRVAEADAHQAAAAAGALREGQLTAERRAEARATCKRMILSRHIPSCRTTLSFC